MGIFGFDAWGSEERRYWDRFIAEIAACDDQQRAAREGAMARQSAIVAEAGCVGIEVTGGGIMMPHQSVLDWYERETAGGALREQRG